MTNLPKNPTPQTENSTQKKNPQASRNTKLNTQETSATAQEDHWGIE
jgi:hypothetical protein